MMQNNEHRNSEKLARFLSEKRTYILLTVCVLAVGISAYVFLSGAAREQKAVDAALSVPTTIVEEEPAAPRKPSRRPAAAEESKPSAPASAEQPLALPTLTRVMPVSGPVLRDYAMDHLTYCATTRDWRVHNGVDLQAQVGENVCAARDGTVSAVFEDPYYGMTVAVEHPGGYTSRYCNLAASVPVRAGQELRAGDVLGTVGETALIETAEGPHLHFEVTCNGAPVDPAGFLY